MGGVRWRQYELIFSVALFLLLLAKVLFPYINTSYPIDASGIQRGPYLLHILISFLLSHVLPLALLFIINLWFLPRYPYSQKKLHVLSTAVIFCWLLLYTAFTISFYLKNFYLTAKYTSGDLWQISRRQALPKASIITIIYLLYCWVRETIIQWVMQEHIKRPFRIMLCNKITATIFVYLGVLLFIAMSKVFRSDPLGIIYIFILLPLIIITFINVYWLFPYRDKMQLSPGKFWVNLFIAPLILSAIAVTFFIVLRRELVWQAFPILTLILVALATPMSWMLYIQQKEKLDVLLQLQKDLGKTTADLAFLRSQINPHFLFNTLNTLYGTALQENARRTAEGVQRLGDMMRFLLHENHRQQIPLKRELEYLNNYIALQQLRIATSKDISIQTDIVNCSYDHLIAPMLLIPFIENAYKHGIRLTTPSFIRINFYCDSKGIYLDVINSLHPKKIQEGMPQHSGVGLQNVKERLQLIYPHKHNLQIQEDDRAFTVHLHIQLID